MKHYTDKDYNEEYYQPGKGTFLYPYTWEYEKDSALKTADHLISLFHPKKVLELGCGRGFLLKALQQLDSTIEVNGCDISRYVIDTCEPEYRGKLKQCDIRDEITYNTFFDLILAFNLFEHIEIEYHQRIIENLYNICSNAVYASMPVSFGCNIAWYHSDKTHVSILSPSYWITVFYQHKFFYDPPKSVFTHIKDKDQTYVSMAFTFYKDVLPYSQE